MPEPQTRVQGGRREAQGGRIQEALHQFLTVLRSEKGAGRHTLRAYQADLEGFSLFCARLGLQSPASIDRRLIRSYLAELQSGRLKKTSILRKMSSIRSFCKFLRERELLSTDPFLNITLPRRQTRLPRFLSESEAGDLLEAKAPGALPRRDRAVLELLYSSGLRREELSRLNCADIDWVAGVVRVFGKGSRERLVPVGARALEALRHLMDERPKTGGHEPIFLNARGGRLSPAGIAWILKRWVRDSGFPKPVTPHAFRHSFATHLLDRGCDLRSVQSMLGHKSLAATQIYTHTSLEQLRRVYRKSHPRGS